MPRHRHRANSHELRHVRQYRGKRRPIGRRRAVLLGSGPSTVIDANDSEPTHTEFRCAIPTDSEIAGHRNKHLNKCGCRCHLLPAPHLISETTAPLSRTCHRDHSLRILLPHKAALRPYGPSLPAHNRDPMCTTRMVPAGSTPRALVAPRRRFPGLVSVSTPRGPNSLLGRQPSPK